MRVGLGIDTGGTYTDSVLFDLDNNIVLSSAKALTTKNNLEIGILESLDMLDNSHFKDVSLVNLSTTLATNASVENRGARGKILFIGIDSRTIAMVGHKYGFTSGDEIYYADTISDIYGEITGEIDFNGLLCEMEGFLADAEGLAIVEVYASKNGAVIEKKAREVFSAKYDFPIICGYELFSDLNVVQRGASALLNIRLIPIINDFMENIKSSLKKRCIDAPINVVRSDCSLMSIEFSKVRPVETILCGPASSVSGAMAICNEENSIIVDMGGTTTDIAIVKNSLVKKVTDGISIGKWRTFVKGVYINTIGLGGDSRIIADEGELVVTEKRVVPICVACNTYQGMVEKLQALASRRRTSAKPLQEFFIRIKDIENSNSYSTYEKKVCEIIGDKAVGFEELCETLGISIFSLKLNRLEREGVILRCGLTPTDVMTVLGDFNKYDKTGSVYAIKHLMTNLALDFDEPFAIENFCKRVYVEIQRKMYVNIAKVLLEDRYKTVGKNGMGEQVEEILNQSFNGFSSEDKTKNPNEFFNFDLKTNMKIIGIGAPTKIFIEGVAKALATTAFISEHSGVANAIGAITTNYNMSTMVEIRENAVFSGKTGYHVFSDEGFDFDDLEDAVECAKKRAEASLVKEAMLRGVSLVPSIKFEVVHQNGEIANNNVKVNKYLGTKVFAEFE